MTMITLQTESPGGTDVSSNRAMPTKNGRAIQLFKTCIHPDAMAAARRVLESGWVGSGPEVEAFEREFAAYIQAPEIVAVNSATSALHLAAVALDLGPGDEVLTTPLTFVSSNAVLAQVGATPVFCDVDPATLLLDLHHAEELVTPRTKAIMAVHYAGNCLDLDELQAFAERHEIAVIEDAAHACGTTFKGRRVGSSAGSITCFSFHAVKNLPCGADGGAVVAHDPNIARRLRRLRWLGIDRSTHARTTQNSYAWDYTINELGFKYQLPEIAGAMARSHLSYLDAWNERRREIRQQYRDQLGGLEKAGLIHFVQDTPGATPSAHLAVLRVPNRDAVSAFLRENGIQTGVHYRPNHHYAPLAACPRDPNGLKVCEAAFREILTLPLHLALSDQDVTYVADQVQDAIAQTTCSCSSIAA
jgi:perosamine synthetase